MPVNVNVCARCCLTSGADLWILWCNGLVWSNWKVVSRASQRNVSLVKPGYCDLLLCDVSSGYVASHLLFGSQHT